MVAPALDASLCLQLVGGHRGRAPGPNFLPPPKINCQQAAAVIHFEYKLGHPGGQLPPCPLSQPAPVCAAANSQPVQTNDMRVTAQLFIDLHAHLQVCIPVGSMHSTECSLVNSAGA